MLKKILADRRKQLGWSPYKVIKEYCRVLGEGTDTDTINRFSSGVRRALANPNGTNPMRIKNIIKAMDGELIVRWTSRKTNVEETVTGQEDVRIDDDE